MTTGNKSMLVIQDDVYAGTLHLDEVILSAITSAECGAAAFAFVTNDGLNAVFGSDEFRNYCKQGHHFELYVGIDSITNAGTLSYAKQLSRELGGRLIIKVYYDESSPNIFHAKTTWFRNPGGDGCVAFVGSGNLTMRGLQRNVEMFSWIEQDKMSFDETMRTWNGWLDAAAKAGRIYDIDEPAILERAQANARRRGAKSGSKKPEAARVKGGVGSADGNLVISTIPSQKTRGWSQFNMAKDFFTGFFGFEIDESGPQPKSSGSRRILLNSVNGDGTLNPTESRAGVVVGSSNYRIELDAARGVHVEQGKFPVAVFLKTGPRSYLYQVFGTDAIENEALAMFARDNNPKLRATSHPKCRIDSRLLQNQMPDLAIFNVKPSFDE